MNIEAMKYTTAFLIIAVLLMVSCTNDKESTPTNTSEKLENRDDEMAEYLTNFYSSQNPLQSPYRNIDQAIFFKNKSNTLTGGQKVELEMRAAYQQLLAGNTRNALEAFLPIKALLEKNDSKANQAYINRLTEF